MTRTRPSEPAEGFPCPVCSSTHTVEVFPPFDSKQQPGARIAGYMCAGCGTDINLTLRQAPR